MRTPFPRNSRLEDQAIDFITAVGAMLHARGWQPLRVGAIDDHTFHWWFPRVDRPILDCTMITATTGGAIMVLPADPGPDEVIRYEEGNHLAGDLDTIESW